MFVSQERGATRKPFQKPNILRRKSKVSRLNSEKNNEAHMLTPLLSASSSNKLAPSSIILEQSSGKYGQSFQIAHTPKFGVVGASEICVKNQEESSQTLEINGDSLTIYAHNAQVDSNDTCNLQSTLNVESFLNDGTIYQDNILFNIDGTTSSRIVETEIKQKWCLDFMSEESKDTVTTNYYDGSQLSNTYIDSKSSDISSDAASMPLAVVSLLNHEKNTSQEFTNLATQSIALDSLNQESKAVPFKCDAPNCNKTFWTEARLQKHKNVHNKPKTPTVLECPVKKTDADGVEKKCGQTFLIRNQLMKHLNEDHSPDDALFRCGLCGRRFFWAGGARAHKAGECARAFACGWAGCGRVFRQPCRLREHARAHTGDRPYACHYPNCGWAFRSASKLVRHARRHTGERRHACGACGRAFLRREHLRDHVRRHHAPPHHKHRCTHMGCEQTFTSVNSLYMHVKKVHKKNEGKPSAPKRAKNAKVKKETFVVSLDDDQIPKFEENIEAASTETCEQTVEESLECASTESDVIDIEEGRCARTHCTWPLQRQQHADYTLEEEPQVEQSESSESNIYTVRSDLFLHGNVLINEDSEFIISRAGAGGTGGEGEEEGGARGAQLDAALGLIDSHPTIDLMQEELMYADAVDESSFRVFLLNGEELT